MRKKEVVFAVGSLGFVALSLGLLVAFPEPNPDNIGFFSNGMNFGSEMKMTAGEYIRTYLASLDLFGWGKFVGGVLIGVFIYIGIPTLVGKYGGDGWK